MTEFKHPIYGNEGLREMTLEELDFYADSKSKTPVAPRDPLEALIGRVSDLEYLITGKEAPNNGN